MKRAAAVFSAILFLIAITSTSPPIAHADLCTEIACIACSVVDYDGEYYTVSVDILNPRDVSAIQFSLIFDENSVSCIDVQPGEKLNSISAPTTNSSIPGKIYFIWDSLETICENTQLLILTFNASSESKRVDVDTEEELYVFNEDLDEIEIIVSGCELSLPKSNYQSNNMSLDMKKHANTSIKSIGITLVTLFAIIITILLFC